MDQKTKTIVVVVLAVLVVGGGFYGFNRWRQQRLANQILGQMYGLNTGMMGGFTGGGKISEEYAKELAKEFAKDEIQQKNDEAKEAAKTPEDRYNDATEMGTYDANSKAVVSEAREFVEKVFGKAKATSVSSGLYGTEFVGSGVVEFTIARLTTGEDLAGLTKALTDKNIPVVYSGIDNKSAGVTAGDNNASYTFGFEIGEQTVGVTIMKTSQQ